MNQTEANKALIRAHYDSAANAYRPSVIDRQVAPDFVDHSHPGVTGPECVKVQCRSLRAAFPDLTVTIEHVIAEGDLVAVRGTWRGTHQGSFQGVLPIGRRIELCGMAFWRVSGGQIRESWNLIDLPALMRQLQG
jgi:predicted ester cyclase